MECTWVNFLFLNDETSFFLLGEKCFLIGEKCVIFLFLNDETPFLKGEVYVAGTFPTLLLIL